MCKLKMRLSHSNCMLTSSLKNILKISLMTSMTRVNYYRVNIDVMIPALVLLKWPLGLLSLITQGLYYGFLYT